MRNLKVSDRMRMGLDEGVRRIEEGECKEVTAVLVNLFFEK